jgi:acetylornithine deacetylase/succinyl-diaminopimelate desuccinylase-like protein
MTASSMTALDVLDALLRIDSVNPGLDPAGAGEAQIAAWIARWGRSAGLGVDVLEGTTGRPSVIIRGGRDRGGRRLLLCGHLDTVGLAGHPDGLTPRVEGDRHYGRGAYDMKAGLAAALIACREAADRGLAGDVLVAAVADEEHASLGIQEVLSTVRADAAIVTEPTELELVVAHKGFVWSEIEVTGRAAHGSRPHLGIDAIVKTGPILTALGALDATLGARTHALLGRGSVHASIIRGGEELSSYPARCAVGIERRTLPGETAADVGAELRSVLEACRAGDAQLEVAQRTLLVREPFEIPQDAAIVELVRTAAAGVLGEAPPISGASYWADAAFIAGADIPTVMFGPGGEGAHAAEESVSISDTEAVTRVLIAVAERVCG